MLPEEDKEWLWTSLREMCDKHVRNDSVVVFDFCEMKLEQMIFSVFF